VCLHKACAIPKGVTDSTYSLASKVLTPLLSRRSRYIITTVSFSFTSVQFYFLWQRKRFQSSLSSTFYPSFTRTPAVHFALAGGSSLLPN